MRILGIDPGLASVGFALLDGLTVLDCATYRTPAKLTTHDRIAGIVQQTRMWINKCDAVAIEDYAYQGAERSNHAAAMSVSRALGAIECAVLVADKPVIIMRRADVLKCAGLKGACDKARAARWAAQMLTGKPLTSEHVRDAAMVAVACRSRLAAMLPRRTM